MPIDPVTTGLAAAGTLGTGYVGYWFANRREAVKTKRDVKHLALDVADVLEQYASSAASIAGDISDHKSRCDPGVILVIAPLPAFPKSHDNWRDLDPSLVHSVQRFEDAHRAHNTSIEGAVEFGDPYDGQNAAREASILHAVQAMTLAAKFRKRYKWPAFDTEAYWPEFLSNAYEQLPEDRKKVPAFTFPPKKSIWERISGKGR